MAPKNFDEQLKYYTERYDEVHVVYCDKCKSPLAFEVKGGVDNAYDGSHPEGRVVIPVSYPDHPQNMALLSWRPRLDGLIGYQCGAMVDNPNYETVKAQVEAAHDKQLKTVKANNAHYKKQYDQAKLDYPKLKEAYDKKLGKKDPNPDLPEPQPPREPDYEQEPEAPAIPEPKQTYCLNNTIMSDQERYKVPVNAGGGPAPVMGPFEREQVRTEIALSGRKPDVEIKGNVKRIEKFKIERVK